MDATAEFRQAAEAYRLGNHAAVLSACDRLLAADPPAGARPAILNLKALGLAANGLIFQAADCLEQAIDLQAENALLHQHYSRILLALGRIRQARRAAERACSLDPSNTAYRYQLARTFLLEGDLRSAETLAHEVADQDPCQFEAWMLLSELAADRGDVAGARACLQQVVERDPDHARAWAALAVLAPDEVAGGPIEQALERIERSAPDAEDAATARFALADLDRRAGRLRNAFARYREANNRLARLRPFDIGGWEESSAATISNSRAWLENTERADHPGEGLVFIVGMPRSGTTLCEQVLSAHSQVLAAGELAGMEYIARALEAGGSDPYMMSPESLEPWRKNYLDSLPPQAGQFLRVTDKAPRNFERLGLIFRLFPGARVLWCRRHPLDVILSCYFQDFRAGQAFSNRLEDIARLYLGHVRLMRHWQTHFGDSIRTVDYADMIEDLETTARSLSGFLGLDFQPAMLEPHRNRRFVLTASADQVRLPVYRSSLDKWRDFHEELKEQIALLQHNGLLDDDCRSTFPD